MEEKHDDNVIPLARPEEPVHEEPQPPPIDVATRQDVDAIRQDIIDVARMVNATRAEARRSVDLSVRINTAACGVLCIAVGAMAVWTLLLQRRVKALEGAAKAA